MLWHNQLKHYLRHPYRIVECWFKSHLPSFWFWSLLMCLGSSKWWCKYLSFRHPPGRAGWNSGSWLRPGPAPALVAILGRDVGVDISKWQIGRCLISGIPVKKKKERPRVEISSQKYDRAIKIESPSSLLVEMHCAEPVWHHAGLCGVLSHSWCVPLWAQGFRDASGLRVSPADVTTQAVRRTTWEQPWMFFGRA